MESERKILKGRKRFAAALTFAAVGLTACTSLSEQVGSADMVDCTEGPRERSTSMNLPEGFNLDLDNYYTVTGSNYPHFRIISEGNGAITLGDAGNDEAKILPDGRVVYDSKEGVHYEVKGSEGPNETTHLELSLSCNNPQ